MAHESFVRRSVRRAEGNGREIKTRDAQSPGIFRRNVLSTLNMRSLVGFALALLVVACQSSPTDPADAAAGAILLRSGHSVQVNAGLRVAFAQIVEDSRCPTTVVCAWQGNGAIRLDITTPGGTQSIVLHTAGGAGFPRQASVAGHVITLARLDPERRNAEPVPMEQYSAAIQVTRAP